VEALDGDAHEEDAHGDFAADGGEAVGDFAEPPVLRGLDSRPGTIMEGAKQGK
jgi:hypothetical protein